jgi:hypothetical protein
MPSTVTDRLGWKRNNANSGKAWIHPTMGRIDQVATKIDPQGPQWTATPRSGVTMPKHFPTPRAARRALGSDE